MAKRDVRISIFGDERDNDIQSLNSLMTLADGGERERTEFNEKIAGLVRHYKIENADVTDALIELVRCIVRDCIKGFKVVTYSDLALKRGGRPKKKSFAELAALANEIDMILASAHRLTLGGACKRYQKSHPENAKLAKMSPRTISNNYHIGKRFIAEMAELEERHQKDAQEGRKPTLFKLGAVYQIHERLNRSLGNARKP